MVSVPMEIDEPAGGPALNITRTLGTVPLASRVSDVIMNFRPIKRMVREDVKQARATPSVLSIDFDDPGELCMTAESDETIQIYNVKDGRRDKSLLSKKYGVKLAKFTHACSSIIYASTKQNDAIRYLATHDNSFIRYFEGHEKSVAALSIHPGNDNFISCSLDDTVRLWDIGTKQWTAKLNLKFPRLAAWDPAGLVFAVACPKTASILLYDHRNYQRAPINIFDMLQSRGPADAEAAFRGWTSLEFSNDGKYLVLGSKSQGNFLIDAFDGSLKLYLRKPNGFGNRRAAPGEGEGGQLETSGDCCFSPCGRYVISGGSKALLVWDTMATPGSNRTLDPTILADNHEIGVVAYNPRYNMIAAAEEELLFWLPNYNN